MSLDLNIEGSKLTEDLVLEMRKYIDHLPDLAKKAFEYLSEDYQNENQTDGVQLFMEHHLEELDEDELEDLFGTLDIDIDLFLSRLVLK